MTNRRESPSTSKKPQMAKYTLDDEIIKDANYFSRNEISWNNRALLSPKIYPFYYKQKDLKKAHVDSLIEQDVQHKKLMEDMRKKNLLKLRTEDLTRYAKHVRQRVVLERQCNQAPSHGDNIVSDDEDITREHGDNRSKLVNNFKPARSRDISWNFLENLSQKQITQYMHPTVVKGEEHMFKLIQSKISEEEAEKEKKQQKKAEFRNRMRQNLHQRHETTFQTESKLNTYSLRKLKSLSTCIDTEAPTVLNLSPTSLNRDEEFFASSMELSNYSPTNALRLKFPGSLPRIERKSYQSLGSGSQIMQIGSPKGNDIQKVLETAHGDLKGSLFQNMERAIYNSTNPLHKMLTTKSDVFKDVLTENLRDKSPSSMYTTSLIKFENLSLESNDRNDRSNRSNLMTKEPWRKASFRSRKTVSPKPKLNKEIKETFDEIRSFETIFDAAVKSKAQGNRTLADADRICQELGVPGVKEFRRKQKEKRE